MIVEMLMAMLGTVFMLAELVLVIAIILAVFVGVLALEFALLYAAAWITEAVRPMWGDRHQKAIFYVPLVLAIVLFVCMWATSGNNSDVTKLPPAQYDAFLAFATLFFFFFIATGECWFAFYIVEDRAERKKELAECKAIQECIPHAWRAEL